jgi:holo-[acyl-carrier protein] synthase
VSLDVLRRPPDFERDRGARVTLRVGIDLASPDWVSDSLRAHGERYLRRVYTATEIEDCRRGGRVDPRLLATRFAAKEAGFKAIGVGAAAASWRDVEVLRGPSGDPRLVLRGDVATLAEAAGIRELSLSLSYAGGVAAAIVIASVSG